MATINISNCKVLMTRTGLAVMAWPCDLYFQPFYCSNYGEFRRYMSDEEAASIVQCNLPHVKFDQHIKVCLPEKWRFLWSWKVSDYTQFKAETCCNGGDYAFHETHNIFGRMNANKLELLDVVRHTTSAEFPYDEANGSSQSDGMAEARFIDVEGDFTLYTQTGSYDEYGYPQDRDYSLSQFGHPIEYDAAASYDDWEIREEADRDSSWQFLSQEERKVRFQILKDTFDWEPPKRR